MRAGGYYLLFITYYIILSLLIIELLGAWLIAQSMIITWDAVPKNACGQVTGNYYITSHGLTYEFKPRDSTQNDVIHHDVAIVKAIPLKQLAVHDITRHLFSFRLGSGHETR